MLWIAAQINVFLLKRAVEVASSKMKMETAKNVHLDVRSALMLTRALNVEKIINYWMIDQVAVKSAQMRIASNAQNLQVFSQIRNVKSAKMAIVLIKISIQSKSMDNSVIKISSNA